MRVGVGNLCAVNEFDGCLRGASFPNRRSSESQGIKLSSKQLSIYLDSDEQQIDEPDAAYMAVLVPSGIFNWFGAKHVSSVDSGPLLRNSSSRYLKHQKL